MYMDRLPSEILQEIVSYLFASDLDSMHLVSRRFSTIDNLLNISQQPHLAQCVREITYPFDRLAPVELDQSNYIMYVAAPKKLAKEFFHWYIEKYVAQIELEASEECLRALETAFSRMPIIKVIVPSYDSFVMRREFKSWLKTLNDEARRIVCEVGDNCWWKILEPIADEGQALDAFGDPIGTAHSLGLKLDSFECGIAKSWFGVGLWVMDLEEMDKGAKEGLHKFLSIAQSLRKLSLTIETTTSQKFLKLAVSIYGDPVFPLLDILGRDHVRKYLHTFSLKFPCICFEEIVEFLGRHASTLKCLHLESPSILNGTWRELLDFLREQLHLTDFKIVSPGEIFTIWGPKLMIYKVYAQLRMKNYVLHKGAPFPFTKQELEKNGKDMKKHLKALEIFYTEKEEIRWHREDADLDSDWENLYLDSLWV
ncbi:hypothetical protein RUND412_005547 [Rhizina undulata]